MDTPGKEANAPSSECETINRETVDGGGDRFMANPSRPSPQQNFS